MKKLKKWGLLYIPTGDFVYQRKDSNNLFIFLTKQLALDRTNPSMTHNISIATVNKKEKPNYRSWSKIMNLYISQEGHTTLRVKTMFKLDFEKLGIKKYSLKDEFEVVEIV